MKLTTLILLLVGLLTCSGRAFALQWGPTPQQSPNGSAAGGWPPDADIAVGVPHPADGHEYIILDQNFAIQVFDAQTLTTVNTLTNFWNFSGNPYNCGGSPSGLSACNTDPHVIRADTTAFDGTPEFQDYAIADATDKTNGLPYDILVAFNVVDIPDHIIDWDYTYLQNFCLNQFGANYPYVTYPQMTVTNNWLVVEALCGDGGAYLKEGIDAIELPSLLQHNTVVNHYFPAYILPSAYPIDVPLYNTTGSTQAHAFFATVDARTAGQVTLHISKLAGTLTSPTWSPNYASHTYSIANDQAIGSTGQVPDLVQYSCTYCLGERTNIFNGNGDVDTWADGDQVAEIAFNGKMFGTPVGIADGATYSAVLAYDLTKGTAKTPIVFPAPASLDQSFSYPSVAHHVYNSSNYQVITLTHGGLSSSGLPEHPSPYSYVYINGVQNSQHTVAGFYDMSNTYPYNYWGDYSRVTFDKSTGSMWFTGDIAASGGNNVQTDQFGYVALP